MVAAYNGSKVMSFGRLTRPHVATAEKVLGRQLKGTELVHHIDENRFNNTPENLVICPSASYHALLHLRATALRLSGNPNFRRCFVCSKYSNPDVMTSMATKKPNGKYKCVTCVSPGGRSHNNQLRLARLRAK